MNDESYKKLNDYGLIGNLETCALVGRDGSIDWLCFPHLESSSVFAAILDLRKGGHFQIRPKEHFESQQAYLEGTNILRTSFRAPSGSATVTDFMPIMGQPGAAPGEHRAVLRKLTCSQGRMALTVLFQPRFDYARASATLESLEGGIVAGWQDQGLFLQAPCALQIEHGQAQGELVLSEGESRWFVLQYGEGAAQWFVPPYGEQRAMSAQACEALLEKTSKYWLNWVHRCEPSQCIFEGPWHEQVVRSGLALKLLTHPETGAIAAAPTTSLPEAIGGVRNWDYRYAWIRDTSFTVQALYNLGHVQEAQDYFRWLRMLYLPHTQYSDPSKIQIMYGLHGNPALEEQELDQLSGYRNSAPVRIGNAAARQKQLDIYGELINAFYETTRYGEEPAPADWQFICRIADYVCQVWDTKDAGIWEVRGAPRHFTYSKLMCWVALDRTLKMAQSRGFAAPPDRWETTRETIRQAILERGFSRKLNSFVQSFDSEALDATSLLIPKLGLLPYQDPRAQGTIEATLSELTVNGLVHRYREDDGLSGGEGAFVLCTFWLVDALVLSGRVQQAEELFSGVLDYSSPLGLLAEEIDPVLREQLGNYPQGFSHIGLINSALYLGRVKGRTPKGPELCGLSSR